MSRTPLQATLTVLAIAGIVLICLIVRAVLHNPALAMDWIPIAALLAIAVFEFTIIYLTNSCPHAILYSVKRQPAAGENKVTKVERAEQLKAKAEATAIGKWGFAVNVWTSPDGKIVRVYVNDRKRKAAAFAEIADDLTVTVTGLAGGSLSRAELTKAVSL
jgi:uncharacterized protein YggU (UPF0235/DUF167 family)